MLWNKIWQADMANNGILPLIKNVSEDQKDDSKGYVIVDENPRLGCNNPNHEPSENREVNVLTNVVIPSYKKKSYELFEKLTDKYNMKLGEKEQFDPIKLDEINTFLQYVISTEPMKIAREYVMNHNGNHTISSDAEWIKLLYDIWFEPRRRGTTSAFEHIFLGEEGLDHGEIILDGHHFWYHYYLKDGPFEITHQEDVIYFLHYFELQRSEKSKLGEVITITYKYLEKTSETDGRVLYKRTGGFFVGLSPEGLLAMGTVAYINGEEEQIITINDETYKLITAIKTEEGVTFFRTFYPKLQNAIRVSC
ncbi:hypothetical protein [Brevibacillus laterosporus]|uniref:hypothetical protein n=1 Tax=Brevibacillus laterosporus TaxID=1465 RepID=UPI003D2135D2